MLNEGILSGCDNEINIRIHINEWQYLINITFILRVYNIRYSYT